MAAAELASVLTYPGLLAGCDSLAAGRSHDPDTKVGAMIVNALGTVVAYGANRLPAGVEPMAGRLERPTKYDWLEHAEASAIAYAAKHGLRLDGGTMVCPWAACAACAQSIITAGLACLVRRPLPPSSWSPSIEIGDAMLREAGVDIVTIR